MTLYYYLDEYVGKLE